MENIQIHTVGDGDMDNIQIHPNRDGDLENEGLLKLNNDLPGPSWRR